MKYSNRTRSIIRIFLASPLDVSDERNITEQVIGEINRTIAPQLGFMLELTRWEDMVPGLGRPQRIILDQADIDDCDLFIGILWNRFGTPTGRAESGTEEEFEVAYSSWKNNGTPHVMFYFSQKPFNLKTEEQIEQKSKIIKFKNRLSKIGIVKDYGTLVEYEVFLRDHLTKHLFNMQKNIISTNGHEDLTNQKESKKTNNILINNTKINDKTKNMILVPAGQFLFGEKKSLISIDYDFFVDPTPVTFKDFVKFVEISNYKLRYESPMLENKLEELFHAAKTHPTYPITGITWYDAIAFSSWCGKRLPTDFEWEKAARGTDGRLFPWGNEFDLTRCNSNESQIGNTTPVDKYENGKSPYGCYDMVGNVFEWTNEWAVKPRFSSTPNTERNNRGGSYNRSSNNLRAWYIESDPPSMKMCDVGFRCVYIPDEDLNEL